MRDFNMSKPFHIEPPASFDCLLYYIYNTYKNDAQDPVVDSSILLNMSLRRLKSQVL